ncbi:hypothetical protein THO17_06780 [Marinomonas sp. THO17]
MPLYPTSPKGVSVDVNMNMIRAKFGKIVGPIDYYWFYQQVRNKGPWDSKEGANKSSEHQSYQRNGLSRQE